MKNILAANAYHDFLNALLKEVPGGLPHLPSSKSRFGLIGNQYCVMVVSIKRKENSYISPSPHCKNPGVKM